MVVNLQGDLPALDPGQIRAVARRWRKAAPISPPWRRKSPIPPSATIPAWSRPVVAWDTDGGLGRALYFTRATAPAGEGPLFHHVGIYAYRRAALARFVALPPSPLEKREKLEQLRALEAGMSIAVARVDSVPLSRRYSGRSGTRQQIAENSVMTKSIDHAKRVAFQGEPGAYANLAAREAMPHAAAIPHAQLRGRDRGGANAAIAISASFRWKIR